MMQIHQRLRFLQFSRRSVPMALLVVCSLAYGLLISGMGFYWDDWPWMWMAHVSGTDSLLAIDRDFRPLSGVILWLGARMAGESPVGWQVYALVSRWLAGLALWWALRIIWPRQNARATWVAMLFLVYPGFTQQFVAVNSSRHILPLAFFFLSLGCMVWAARERRFYLPLTCASLLLGLAAMLATDYYYGLELARPLVLWLAQDTQQGSNSKRFWKAVRDWVPYLALVTGLFGWRYMVSRSVNYPVTITAALEADPLNALVATLNTLWHNLVVTTASAWAKVFAFPAPDVFGEKKTLFFWGLAAASACGAMIYLSGLREESQRDGWWKGALGLGLFSLLAAGIPFWATDLEVNLGFPASRTTLPMMFGASLLFVGLLEGLVRYRLIKIVVISLAVGLAVGVHFQTAVSFQRDWNYQVAFLRQLAWRAPALKPGTTLLTSELPNSYSSDNSLTAPLNWIFAADYSTGDLPLMIAYLELRLGNEIPSLEKGIPFSMDYGDRRFSGSTDNLLVIYHAPPACLRVLHPAYDLGFPHLPNLIERAISLSNPGVIDIEATRSAVMPVGLFGAEPEPGWCYYFEKADLARQQGDWEQVVAYGEAAFQSGDSPNHASERVPFLQGYAFTGQWKRASELTFETLSINKFMEPMLCNIWRDIELNTPPSDEKDSHVERVYDELGCASP